MSETMNGHEMSEKPSSHANGAAQHQETYGNGEEKERLHNGEQDGEKQEQKKDQEQGSDTNGKEEPPPEGGFDATPVPRAPPGYTVKITFHRATNLPMADLNSLSSDPWILAQINTSLPMRHKEDPLLRMRTPTVRRNTDPVWDCEWVVANLPASGFKLKARLYDEDPADHDDRLGNVHITIPRLDESWQGFKDQPHKIMKRSGSKRAYLVRAVAACMSKAKHMSGDLYVSIENLGRTESNNGGRPYTVGPCFWLRHYSPMLGRIANRKEPSDDEDGGTSSPSESEKKRKAERYNFQANQFQFQGPVPDELYHRYVEFRPFVKAMFTSSGVRGWALSKALHHQHARVYNFDRVTKWGHFSGPGREMTQAFLDLVHYDQGGRVFTYVLSLDALFRFTETGKEFGIDMLSKHTMHSDVSVYIAFSGEFFVRRLKHGHRPPPPDPVEVASQDHSGEGHEENGTHPPDDISGGPPEEPPPKDPAHYELVIDNDSGTYRPNAKMLPLLKKFLARSLPGLHILTLDCQADADKMAEMKQAQRERKEKEGDTVVFTQGSRSSSISSSDEEELDALEASEQSSPQNHGIAHHLAQDANLRGKARVGHLKQTVPGTSGRPSS